MNNEMEMTKKQKSTRGGTILLSLMSGVVLTNEELKTIAVKPFAEWPEDLKEKTSPACGAVEMADNEAASAQKTS